MDRWARQEVDELRTDRSFELRRPRLAGERTPEPCQSDLVFGAELNNANRAQKLTRSAPKSPRR